jgi:molybdate transport system ATP-binding protein
VSLECEATLAERGFSVALTLADGERVAVLGHNGAGKSTLLAVLAGTIRPDSGRAVLDGEVLFDVGGRSRCWTPPHRRGVALMAQDALLFPHLSVAENVAFGPRAAGSSPAEARARAGRWLEEVGASELADRRPGQLSGGQAQRVAIARALAAEPRLLLLDEPLAALDVAVAPLLRRLLRGVLAGRQAIVVTHDLLDALLLSERVVVLDGGRVAESGPTEKVLRHPTARFTAKLAGLNLVRGVLHAGGVLDRSGLQFDGVRREASAGLVEGDQVAAVFSPAAVSIHLAPPGGSPRNIMEVTVAELEPRGDLIQVRGDDGRGHVIAADVTPGSVAELDLYPGRRVTFAVKAAAVTIYPL